MSDVTIDPRYAGRVLEGRYESASFVVAPLAVGERRLGVLCATERLRGDFGDEDLCLLRLLAMQIAELMIRSSEEGLAFIEAEALPDGSQLASASAETPCDGDSLDADTLDTDSLLLEACVQYALLGFELTPEMRAFAWWHLAVYPSEESDRIETAAGEVHELNRDEQIEFGAFLLTLIHEKKL